MSGAAQAAPPQTGMRRIGFPLESYQATSLPLSNKRLLNFMAEKQPDDARTAAALLPTPGLAPLFSVGTGPVVVMNNEYNGWWYVVSGSVWYRYRFTGPAGEPAVTETLMTLPPPAIAGRWNYLNMITIAVGVQHAVVCVPPKAFVVDHADGSPASEITGMLGQATSVAYLDGYFVFSSPGVGFFISGLNDPTTFDGLDFARNSLTGDVRVMVLNKQLWFGGPDGLQVWYDSGDADFPFRPIRGVNINQGVGYPQSMAIGDTSLFWVGLDRIIYRTIGYDARRISTHAIESIALAEGDIVSAFMTTFRGHICYVVNWADRTLVYDCATQVWHERASSTDGTGRWRANCAAPLEIGRGVVGDSLSGTVFESNNVIATDGDVLVHRMAITPQIWGGTRRVFQARLEIEMEVGTVFTPGHLTLDWSDDGGHTWSAGRVLPTGAAGAYRTRVVTTRLGSFRDRIYRVQCNGMATLYGIDGDPAPGAS